jgi:hypothetical protein
MNGPLALSLEFQIFTANCPRDISTKVTHHTQAMPTYALTLLLPPLWGPCSLEPWSAQSAMSQLPLTPCSQPINTFGRCQSYTYLFSPMCFLVHILLVLALYHGQLALVAVICGESDNMHNMAAVNANDRTPLYYSINWFSFASDQSPSLQDMLGLSLLSLPSLTFQWHVLYLRTTWARLSETSLLFLNNSHPSFNARRAVTSTGKAVVFLCTTHPHRLLAMFVLFCLLVWLSQ